MHARPASASVNGRHVARSAARGERRPLGCASWATRLGEEVMEHRAPAGRLFTTPPRGGRGRGGTIVPESSLVPAADQPTSALAVKPPWRFARERRLGRVARQLLDVAEARMPSAVAVLGPEVVLEATRRPGWALACLERAAACDDGSKGEEAWVVLAACRPTLVRRAIHASASPSHRGRAAA